MSLRAFGIRTVAAVTLSHPAMAQGVLPAGGAFGGSVPAAAEAAPLPVGKAAGLLAAQQLVGSGVALAGLGGVAVAAVALVMAGGSEHAPNLPQQQSDFIVATTGTK